MLHGLALAGGFTRFAEPRPDRDCPKDVHGETADSLQLIRRPSADGDLQENLALESRRHRHRAVRARTARGSRRHSSLPPWSNSFEIRGGCSSSVSKGRWWRCLLVVAGCLRLGMHDGLTLPHVAKKAALLRARAAGGVLLLRALRPRDDAPRAWGLRARAPRASRSASWCSFSFSGTSFRRSQLGRGVFLGAVALIALVGPSWRTASTTP